MVAKIIYPSQPSAYELANKPIPRRFSYLDHNMSLTEGLLHREIPNRTISKIILFVSVLFAAVFEGVVKNGAYLLINGGICIANQVHRLYVKCARYTNRY